MNARSHPTTSPSAPKITLHCAFSAIVAALGMFGYGYHISELSASASMLTCAGLSAAQSDPTTTSLYMPLSLRPCIPLDPHGIQFSLLVAMLSVGGLIGALTTGPLCLQIGRRGTLCYASLLAFLSPLCMSLANHYVTLIIGRLLAGMASGTAATTISMYLPEIAPPQHRGVFGSLSQVMLNLGVLTCSLMNRYFASAPMYWRLVVAGSGIFSIIQACCLPFVSPSPKDAYTGTAFRFRKSTNPSLSNRRRLSTFGSDITINSSNLAACGFTGAAEDCTERAARVLLKLWGENTDRKIISEVLFKYAGSAGKQIPSSSFQNRKPFHSSQYSGNLKSQGNVVAPFSKNGGKPTRQGPVRLLEFITSSKYRKALILLTLAHVSLQACGIAVYLAYSSTILTMVFPKDLAQTVFSCAIAYEVLSILAFGRLLDRFGRRPMFLLSYFIMGMSAFVLNTGTILHEPILAVAAFFAAITGFALGMGNVPYVLIGEVVDAPAVSSAATISLVVNWTTQFVYLVAFLPLLKTIGSWIFVIVGTITLSLGIAVLFVMPETKGKAPDEVHAELNNRRRGT